MNWCHCLRVSRVSTCIAMTSVHPASIAVNHALFSSIDTCVAIESLHPASIAAKHALFSSIDTCVDNDISSSNFHCSETLVILINGYVEGTPFFINGCLAVIILV